MVTHSFDMYGDEKIESLDRSPLFRANGEILINE